MSEQRGDQDIDVGEMSHVRARTPASLADEALGKCIRETCKGFDSVSFGLIYHDAKWCARFGVSKFGAAMDTANAAVEAAAKEIGK